MYFATITAVAALRLQSAMDAPLSSEKESDAPRDLEAARNKPWDMERDIPFLKTEEHKDSNCCDRAVLACLLQFGKFLHSHDAISKTDPILPVAMRNKVTIEKMAGHNLDLADSLRATAEHYHGLKNKIKHLV